MGNGTKGKEIARKAPETLVDEGPDPPVYADFVQANISYFGFKLVFGSVQSHPTEDHPASVLALATIGMSPEHAKSFRGLLDQQIQKYEKKFGAIRPTPSGSG